MVADRTVQFRAHLLFYFLFVLFGLLLSRSIYLQAYESDKYSEMRDAQLRTRVEIAADRGAIFDRNGNVLAVSVPVKSLFAVPGLVERRIESAYAVAEALDLNGSEVAARLERTEKQFVWIKRHLTEEEVAAVRALDLVGFGFRDELKRCYPNGELAAHVLGACDIDQNGLGGIELQYDDDLEGDDGYRVAYRDALCRMISYNYEDGVPAVAGHNLVLTIDAHIQSFLEEALEHCVEEWKPQSINGIVMDPKTGAVLAMASYPTYDPNHPGDYPLESQRNRSLTDTFEPGSMNKPLVIASAIENGVVTPDTLIQCEHGSWRYRSRTLTDVHGYGIIPVSKVLYKSSNIGAVKVGLMLQEWGRTQNRNMLREVMLKLGFSSKLGIDLPGEAAGRLTREQDWKWFSDTSVPMGYEVSTTPLQVCASYCALSNGGKLMKPFVVKEIRDANDVVIRQFQPQVISDVYKPETSAVMRDIMVMVVEDGTAKRARLENYLVAGKTGTTKKLEANGRYGNKYYSSFCAFAPAQDPQFVVLVSVSEPKGHSYFGGTVAGPAVQEVLGKALSFYRVPLTRPKDGSFEVAHPGHDE